MTFNPSVKPQGPVLDFSNHARSLADNVHVYAVISRRSRGLSIGINLNADKVCNFDCPYCQVDRRRPGGPREVDLGRLEAELRSLFGMIKGGQLWEIYPFNTAEPEMQRVNDIALAGDGEPTTCKQLGGVVELVGQLRQEHGLDDVKLHMLTNATMFHRPAVEAALDRWAEFGGEVWAKLDAGTAPYFRLVDGTTIPFHRVLGNIKAATKRWPTRLQCMFHTWEGQAPDNAEIQAWADHIEGWIDEGGKILEVQVYSVARRPMDERVGILPEKRLERIAKAARDLGVDVTVYPGVEWKK